MNRPLIDTFGRTHRDLRISITDRCNFRCTYCMPEEGLDWLPREDLLTFEEIERLARLLVERHGIDSIRLTGGEPTVRAHLPVLIKKLAALPADLAMTTNGVTLPLIAPALAEAGLKRINISLDSFKPERFQAITRRDDLDKVLDGIDAAIAAGLNPVKINAVMMRGVNDDELLDFARFGREKGVIVRFIEFMPLDADQTWTNETVVSVKEIVEHISEMYPLEPMEHSSAPAARWRYVDGGGQIGIVASVTQSFCDSCDRIRLTAEGKFRNCLFSLDELDMRTLMRSGATDDELSERFEAGVLAKWAGHQINQVHFIRPKKSMSQIGG